MEMMEIPRKVRKKRTNTKPYNAKREVSVKHLLSSQPDGYDTYKPPYFDVNVRVGFNGKYVNFRSYTLAKRKLRDDLVNEIMFKREKELIVLYVEGLIKKHKSSIKKGELPEDTPFDIRDSYYTDSPRRLFLSEIVETLLFKSILDFEKKYSRATKDSSEHTYEITLHRPMNGDAHLYVLYRKQFDERYQEIIDQYPLSIWTFKIFIGILEFNFNTIPDTEDTENGDHLSFNLADYRNGFFQTTAKLCGEIFGTIDEANLIISWLDILIKTFVLEEGLDEDFDF